MSSTTSPRTAAPGPTSGREAAAELEAVPLRHWGRWAAAAVVLYVTAAFVWSLARNPNLEWDVVADYLFEDFVVRGVGITLMLTVVAMGIGTVGGIVVAVMRLSSNPVLRGLSWFYTWFFRGTPLLVQIIFWGFLAALYQQIEIGIPFTDVTFASFDTNAVVGPMTAAILALSLNEVAYAAEIVRGGIASVDGGQDDAASALGMTRSQAMRTITLPQAMRVIVPPMGNETVTMLKSTALVSVIGGKDLLTAVQSVYAQNYQVIPLLVVAVIWYLALTSVLSVGQYFVERRYGKGHGNASMSRRWLGLGVTR